MRKESDSIKTLYVSPQLTVQSRIAMFNDRASSEGSPRNCGDPRYNTYRPTNQPVYNANCNADMRRSYVYPFGAGFSNDAGENSAPIRTAEEREADERNIESFLLEADRASDANDRESICNKSKIAMAKDALMSANKLNEKLRTICAEIEGDRSITAEEWQEKMNICNTARDEIVKLLEPVKGENFLKQLKKSLERRRKKRLREKIKREQWRSEKLMRTERRARLHGQIDSWIRKEQAVIEKEKQEENLRKDADMILSDVRGKRSDARKYLGLLLELRNLRNVKANIARARGEHLSSAADSAFNNIIAKLIEQWSTLDREYSIEEQGLKLMLKTDNEERIEKQKKSLFDQWENVLFGKRMLMSDQYNTDLANFIAIRTAWDEYISPDGDASAIPVGWVMPDKPSSAAWQKCLKKEIP